MPRWCHLYPQKSRFHTEKPTMPTEAVLEMLIPISLFIATVLIVWIVVAFRYRSRRDVQATYRAAIERGQELTPELLDRLGEPRSKNKDLRRGMILIGV